MLAAFSQVPMSEAEQRLFDTLLDNLDGMVYRCLYDAKWTMTYVSKGCEALTGFSALALLHNQQISYEEMTYPEDRSHVRSTIAHAISSRKRYEIEYRIVSASGQVVWVAERGNGVYDQGGHIVALEGIIIDINARKKVEQELFNTEQQYRSMFENATLGMFQTTESGSYLNANQALANLYRYANPQALIKALNNINTSLYVSKTRRAEFIEEIRQHGRVRQFESQVYQKDNSVIWISENAHVVYDTHGEILYFEGTVEDITERKHSEELIRQQAVTDHLTGLLNRSALNSTLTRMMQEADLAETKLAICFIDLDHFKLINDTLGHRAGDKLLENVAQRLTKSSRPTDAIVRFGGDEFVMLYPNLRDISDVDPLLKRVMESVSQPLHIDGYTFNMTCSMGVSVYPDHATQMDTLLSYADSALYSAKNAGKNNSQLFSSTLAAHLNERNYVEYELGHALQRKEFTLHYQPKINLRHGGIVSLEALIRWQHPERGLISPDQFIPIAEETGSILAIGEWVLHTVCEKIQSIYQRHGYYVPIAINVSPIQFIRGNLVETVQCALQTSAVPPHLVTLEVTENARFKDEAMFVHTLHRLKALGVCLAIDDFGIGYSNMAYLKNYPIDELKIDKAFLQDLAHNNTNGNILLALINLGKSLHKSVTAEGIETEFEHTFLVNSGCDVGQGYFYHRPLSPEKLEILMQTQPAQWMYLHPHSERPQALSTPPCHRLARSPACATSLY